MRKKGKKAKEQRTIRRRRGVTLIVIIVVTINCYHHDQQTSSLSSSLLPPFQQVPRILSPGVKQPGVKMATHLNLVTRFTMTWATHLRPLYAFMAWRGKRQIYSLYLYILSNIVCECVYHTRQLINTCTC